MPTQITLSRRSLLRGVAWAAGSVVVESPPAVATAATAARAPTPEPAPANAPATAPAASARLRRTLLQTSPVAGFQYHDGEAVWHALRQGDPLALVREPGNRHDARAVRLEWEGHKIGYVPALDNAAISQLLDRDLGLDAVITRLQEAHSPWDRVQVAVYLTV